MLHHILVCVIVLLGSAALSYTQTSGTTDGNGNQPTSAPSGQPNNFSPVFETSMTLVSLNESSQQVFVATLTATDADIEGPQSAITYCINQVMSTNNITRSSQLTTDVFIITSNGILIASDGLDAEQYTLHQMTVTASDMGVPVRSAMTTVIVDVLDVNDNAPIFTETLYTADPQIENAPESRSIFDVNAIDNDIFAPNNVIQSYSLGNYQNIFRIDSNGTIETALPLDAETQVEYLINVSAVDGGIPSQTGYTTVLLRVVDVNDNPAFVNQMERSIHIIHGGPTSISPAISINDPDNIPSMIDRISIELIPNNLDRFLCQDVSLETFEPELLSQSIDLLDLTIFQQDQPELNGITNFSPITLGARGCRAWELRRGSIAESDGYGRIPKSSLPPDFAVGDFSLSFTLVQSSEGYVILVPDQSDRSLPPNMVEHQFAIWIDHDQLIFYYTTMNLMYDSVEFPNETAEVDFGELFNPSSPVPHYFTVIVRSSQQEVEVFADCQSIGYRELRGPVLTPFNEIEVFIGQSRPRSTSNGRFAGVISDLYYYSTALTADQVNNLGMCDRKELIRLPLSLPNSVRATTQEDTRLVIEPTSGIIPVDDATSVLRGITYENTFYSPILDPDRQLIFIVREVPGFEGISVGFIKLAESDVDTTTTVIEAATTPSGSGSATPKVIIVAFMAMVVVISAVIIRV